MISTELDEIAAEDQDRIDQFETNFLNVEPRQLVALKAELRDLIELNKEFLEEGAGIGVVRYLGPVMFVGFMSWALIFRFIDYLN